MLKMFGHVAGYAAAFTIRLVVATIIAIVWFFTSGSLAAYVDLLQNYPLKWLLTFVQYVIIDVWNPTVGAQFPILYMRGAVVTNASRMFEGKTMLIPSIMFVLVFLEAIIAARRKR